MILGGFGAPLFLLLAGVSVVAVGRLEGAPDRRRRRRRSAVMRRGLEIFLLAFVFRFQAWILGLVVAVDAPERGHPQHHGPGDRRRRGALGRRSHTVAASGAGVCSPRRCVDRVH